MEEGENKQGHGDLGSAISAAQKYVKLIKDIETELEGQVIALELQVEHLKVELDNASDFNCPEEDDMEYETEEELARGGRGGEIE